MCYYQLPSLKILTYINFCLSRRQVWNMRSLKEMGTGYGVIPSKISVTKTLSLRIRNLFPGPKIAKIVRPKSCIYPQKSCLKASPQHSIRPWSWARRCIAIYESFIYFSIYLESENGIDTCFEKYLWLATLASM